MKKTLICYLWIRTNKCLRYKNVLIDTLKMLCLQNVTSNYRMMVGHFIVCQILASHLGGFSLWTKTEELKLIDRTSAYANADHLKIKYRPILSSTCNTCFVLLIVSSYKTIKVWQCLSSLLFYSKSKSCWFGKTGGE